MIIEVLAIPYRRKFSRSRTARCGSADEIFSVVAALRSVMSSCRVRLLYRWQTWWKAWKGLRMDVAYLFE